MTRRLERLVAHYGHTFGPRRRADRQRYAAMPDLKTAIRNAALARRPDGKCESHQRRIGLERLKVFERALQAVRRDIGCCQDFDQLHGLIKLHRTDGVGALAVYDTAVRIGAHLGIMPTRVYLHAGTQVGAREIGLLTAGGFLNVEDLPETLRQLSPDEVEDFLCIYKAALRDGRAPGGCGPQSPKRRSTC